MVFAIVSCIALAIPMRASNAHVDTAIAIPGLSIFVGSCFTPAMTRGFSKYQLQWDEYRRLDL